MQMKKNIFQRFSLILAFAGISLGFVACSNDEEPSPQSKELNAAIERLYTENGEPNVVGFILDNEVAYVALADTPESGKTILGYYLGEEVKSDNYIRKFDGQNNIRVSSGEEGVFYNVSVNFSGYKPYSFKVAPMQWLMNDNTSVAPPFKAGGAAIICLDCGAESHWYRMTTETPSCGKCGSKHVRMEPRAS